MADGFTFKGVQTGGVSAGPLKDEHLDIPVDFDSLGDVGGMLGSGGWVIFDESVNVVDFARYLTAFNRYESCSKCVPCRLGNPALVEILDRIRFGRGSMDDLTADPSHQQAHHRALALRARPGGPGSADRHDGHVSGRLRACRQARHGRGPAGGPRGRRLNLSVYATPCNAPAICRGVSAPARPAHTDYRIPFHTECWANG